MPIDPLHIPDAFWTAQDLREILARRAIGELFRLLRRRTGASQNRIGAAVGLEQGYVSRIIAGRKVTSIEVLERIADGLGMPDDARQVLGLAAREEPPPSRAARTAAVADAPGSRAVMVEDAVDLWRGDMRRRDVLRQTAYGSAGYAVSALRWFTSPPATP